LPASTAFGKCQTVYSLCPERSLSTNRISLSFAPPDCSLVNSIRLTCRITRRVIFGLVCIAVSLSSATLEAGGRSTWNSAAVDAKGVRHWGRDYPNGGAWMNDAINAPSPHYPPADRAQLRTGSGLFRLIFDLKTGSVTKVTTLQSTGVPSLDSAATGTFLGWRWKPGKWKEIDVPITFTLRSESRR